MAKCTNGAKMKHFLTLDVESVGLLGEGFAWATVLTDATGKRIEERYCLGSYVDALAVCARAGLENQQNHLHHERLRATRTGAASMIQRCYIQHYLYGKITAIVGEFCFFEMGLTHSKHTIPHEFLGKAEAEAFLASTYPGDDSYKVVPVE